MSARTLSAALAELDGLLAAIKDKDAQIDMLKELTRDLVSIISRLETERDNWRARSGQ